jgi:hypothetical protein
VRDIRADGLAKVRDLVHERNLRGQQRIRGVLGHLRARVVHHENRSASPAKRRVQIFDDLGRSLVGGADDDAIGFEEILDCRAFLHELRVGDHIEGVFGDLGHDVLDLRMRADRHGTLRDDDLVAVHDGRYVGRYLMNEP